jgi:pyridoxamine 5'-phosphate oxidase
MDTRIAALRREYAKEALDEQSVAPDPIMQFRIWFDQALEARIADANAMTLATVSQDGRPSARVVLIKDISDEGLSFFTNYLSAKARDLEAVPYGALVFYWAELERQVRFEGPVERVPDRVSDEYFATRPRASQIGAWASAQSEVVESRAALEKELAQLDQRYAEGEVPRPDHWGGYILKPESAEIWQGRPGRLHDRIRYTLEDEAWRVERLAP